MLEKAQDAQLADVWQRVCPFPIDLAPQLPDRQGAIEDLADFAEVLQPGLDGLNADGLCRLIARSARL